MYKNIFVFLYQDIIINIMQSIFLNCLLQTVFDSKRKKIRITPIAGQVVPMLFVRCSRKQRESLPIGSVFNMDVKFIQPKNKKPYLLARTPFSLMQLSLF